jgi:hypothetical protein
MEKFQAIITRAKNLLDLNKEWERRYENYATGILNNIEKIKKNKKRFYEASPLYLYMNVGQAKCKASIFSLRYLGQNVAVLRISDDKISLDSTRFIETNKRDFSCEISVNAKNGNWDGGFAREFRKHFKKMPIRSKKSRNHNEEHRIESMLLTELSKKQGQQKHRLLHNIQPVKIAKIARFQMPTPFRASGGKIEYANKNGGGIDILARISRTKLCIMELKDEYSRKEPPESVIRQGLTYATFIRELLRSQCGGKWWKIFGFTGSIPKKLILCVACVMPLHNNIELASEGFRGKRLKIDSDILELHYIYFTEERKIRDIRTSLRRK